MRSDIAAKRASDREWDRLVSDYRGKISKHAADNYGKLPGYTREDLESELLEVLWRSKLAFREGRNATFNTFFWTAVKNRQTSIVRSLFAEKRKSNLHNETLSCDATFGAADMVVQSPSPEDLVIARMAVEERMERYMASQKKRAA